MFLSLHNNSNFFKVIILIGIIFLISANLAWLNPQGGDRQVYKTHNKFPLFWQYNPDSGIEILTASYFPKIFYKNKTRIDRPTYPILANTLGKMVGFILSPFMSLNILEKTGIGYLILKLIIFTSSSIIFLKIIKFYFNSEISFLSLFFTYTTSFSIFYITAFHTSELQFITPIFINAWKIILSA